jgi:antitoxin ParD1/3/4
MLAYKQYVTISDPSKMELTNLPFRKGQRIEVVMIADDDDRAVRVEELQNLFKNTQALPHIQAISEDMIAEEIEKYRSGT